MAIDTETFKPRIHNVTGGLSGPAIKPITLRLVYQCAQAVMIPVIGLGGIFTAEDAYEKIKAGASAVQIFTGVIYEGPAAVKRINRGLLRLMEKDGFKSISEVVGSQA
jgi:dihydroorotate dehydrogenase (NAD+) catalytic subunit